LTSRIEIDSFHERGTKITLSTPIKMSIDEPDRRIFNDQNFNFIFSHGFQLGPLRFPTTDGLAGQVLATDGHGHLEFINSSSGTVVGPGSSTDNSIALFNGTSGNLLKDSLGFINGSGQLTIPSIVASGLSYPTTDGTNGQAITTNGFGNLSFSPVGNVSGPLGGGSTDFALVRWNGTTGKFVNDSLSTLDNLGHLLIPALTVGTVLFPSVDGTNGQVLTTDGANTASWRDSSVSQNRLLGSQSVYVGADVSAGDHIQFDTVFGSNGSTISLDISTPYTNAANVDSIGRVTLQGGRSYVLYATIQELTFTSLATGELTFRWYDADNNTAVTTGAGGEIFGDPGLTPVINAPTTMAWVSPGVDTRYELRITSAVSLTAIGPTTLDVSQVT
jgi:hypothetical protein